MTLRTAIRTKSSNKALGYQLVSIVLPVRNQADHIYELIQEHLNQLAKLDVPYELVLVANACEDNSAEICQQLSEEFSQVRTVSTPIPGWGSAIKFGLKNAQGDLLCYASSARTSPPVLLQCVQHAIDHPGIVITTQRLLRDNWLRSAGSALYNAQCRVLFDVRSGDINGSPKVFPADYKPLLGLTEDGFLVDLEFNIICRTNRYDVVEIPVDQIQRHGGRSTTGWWTAFDLYRDAFIYWRKKDRAGR